jgi:hypothetical protein
MISDEELVYIEEESRLMSAGGWANKYGLRLLSAYRELKAENEKLSEGRRVDDRLPPALRLPYDLEQGLNQAIREGLRDAGVKGIIARHVARILDRIAPWINRELELKSVVHQCCVDVQDFKIERERLINLSVALESELAAIKEGLAYHSKQYDDPCEDRGVDFPCDVARVVFGIEDGEVDE